ncbi:hypothetical protein ACTWPT_41035 [Nonomuraea sp. 3N208]|uniref:hypothetical protein n=1 Tax=Nonomuraea sp. 3N208 TaxID=3457421 RepID=UPI003FD219FB
MQGGRPCFGHTGETGTVVALIEAGWTLGDSRFEEEAVAAADRVVRAARPLDGGPGWTGDLAQRGDGGIVLGLLRAATALGVPAYEEVAVAAGERIAALAVPGYMVGAAGIGAALQSRHARRVILLPDSPFPAISVPPDRLRDEDYPLNQ